MKNLALDLLGLCLAVLAVTGMWNRCTEDRESLSRCLVLTAATALVSLGAFVVVLHPDLIMPSDPPSFSDPGYR